MVRTSLSLIGAHMKGVEKDVAGAVSRSIHAVVDTIDDVDQTLVQLKAATVETELDEVVVKVVQAPTIATSSSDPH